MFYNWTSGSVPSTGEVPKSSSVKRQMGGSMQAMGMRLEVSTGGGCLVGQTSGRVSVGLQD